MAELHPLPPSPQYSDDVRLARANAFADELARRRTVRDFAATPVPRAVIEACLRAAGSAPSGANQQPWHFVAISDPAVKRSLRDAAEAEEREFYGRRAPQAWLDALAPLGTNADKPFLDIAPWLALGSGCEEVLPRLAQLPSEVTALVGHEPIMSSLTSMLTGSGRLSFSPGTSACLEFDRKIEVGQGRLLWLLEPR